MTGTSGHDGQDLEFRLVRLARTLEANGIYNGAKLLRALAFSEETRATRQADGRADPGWVEGELKALIREISAQGAPSGLVSGLEQALSGYRENRTIRLEDIPRVFVCRFCGELAFEQPPARCPACGARYLSFREFLPYYFLDPLTPAEALAGLRSAAGEVIALTQGLSEAQMSWSPEPGEWSISNLLWHLLVAQQLLSGRMEKMLAEENPSLQSLAAWAAGAEESSSGAEILGEYLRSRQAAIARLEGLSPADWLRSGQHDEFGQVTILTQAAYFARHDQYHLVQLDSLRAMVVK